MEIRKINSKIQVRKTTIGELENPTGIFDHPTKINCEKPTAACVNEYSWTNRCGGQNVAQPGLTTGSCDAWSFGEASCPINFIRSWGL